MRTKISETYIPDESRPQETSLFQSNPSGNLSQVYKSQISWKSIKQNLEKLTKAELVSLISNLYSLNASNQRFLNACFSESEENIASYKEIIRETVFPKLENREDLQLSEGRKAIRDYQKSGGDLKNTMELMVYYIECGNDFTLAYGDIDAKFYNSIISMFTDVLERLQTSEGKSLIPLFLPRLQTVVQKSDGIGWGYHDDISYLLRDFIKASNR